MYPLDRARFPVVDVFAGLSARQKYPLDRAEYLVLPPVRCGHSDAAQPTGAERAMSDTMIAYAIV